MSASTSSRIPRTAYTGAALVTAGSTTLTAYELPGTTGVAVINGSTIFAGGSALTLANGDVVSLGADGLVDNTMTITFSSTSVSACPVPKTRNKTSIAYTGASSGAALSSTATQSGGGAGTTTAATTGAVSTGSATKKTVASAGIMAVLMLIASAFTS